MIIHEISELLKHCEEKEPHRYITDISTYKWKIRLFRNTHPEHSEPVEYTCKDNEEIFVVSDLHISSGRNDSGVYPGTENFFADEQFARFLSYANRVKKAQKAILILNGDVFDFLRVTEYPGKIKKVTLLRKFRRIIRGKGVRKFSEGQYKKIKETEEQEYLNWKEILCKVGIEINIEELQERVKSEIKNGLKTNNYKSIWKLNFISKGHRNFFKALASWIKEGNKIFIVKGNHDLEWYYLSVRNYFRLLLAELLCKKKSENTVEVLKKVVLPNIFFFDNSITIDNDFYVEHGHRYDKFTFVIDNPLLVTSKNIKPQYKQSIDDELNIPFGSFFNRYLINKVELIYPFADNVRPTANILPMMIRERFPLALKILLDSRVLIYRIFKTLNGIYLRFMLNRVLWFAIAALVPLGFILYLNLDNFISYFFTPTSPAISRFGAFINNLIISTALLILAYVLSRIISWFQLKEPDSLADYAKEIFRINPRYRIITMGHTHNPGEYKMSGEKRFYNTGTWIPIVEASSAEVREDKTYTFLHLERDEKGRLEVANKGLLQRWNDDAGRGEAQILIQRK